MSGRWVERIRTLAFYAWMACLSILAAVFAVAAVAYLIAGAPAS